MTTFSDMNLSPDLLKAIEALGFKEPTAVQARVIPHLLQSERDLVALAQTGTGKTAAFGLPLLQKVDPQRFEPQALVLCPTRELCMQITRDLESFAKFLPRVRALAVYGGASIGQQIGALKRGVQVVAATPGRMNDLLRRGVIDLSQIRSVVLDEADEMLTMGFQEELESILKHVPDEAQTLLFSATMPAQVASIARGYMHDPHEITVGKRNVGSENVTHEYYMVHAKDRYRALKRIVDVNPGMYSIVFCRTRADTQAVAKSLIADGYNADALHGDLSQVQRDLVMESFRDRSLELLVATDVAARGLDVNDLTHVINYNLPDDVEYYTHRSGRTGRAGRKGVSISILHMREKGRLRRIEHIIKREFVQKDIPSGKHVCEAQLMALIDRMRTVEVNQAEIAPYLPSIYEALEGMDWQDLVHHFVSVEFNRFLKYYRNAPDLNVKAKSREPAKTRDRLEGKVVKLSVNRGREDGFTPKELIVMVNRATRGHNVRFGRITLLLNHTHFEVDPKDVPLLTKALKGVRHHKRVIQVGPAKPETGPKLDTVPTGRKPSRTKTAADKARKPRHRKSRRP